MTLPEVYRVDTEIHSDVQLDTPMIKLEEKCVPQSKPKLVWDMALLHDTPTPPQTIAQPMTEQMVLLPDRALQGKLIPITHASQRETFRSESVRKETPTYTDSICRHSSKPPDKQNSQLTRILLDLEMNLDTDNPHNIRNKTRKILYAECIGIIFLMFRKVKIVIVNLIEFL